MAATKPKLEFNSMEQVPDIDEDWDEVPKTVRDLQCWGVYDVFGDKRPTSVTTRRSDGWPNPDNWVGFERAFEFCESNERFLPGFFFSNANRVAGIDLDSCRDPSNGIIEPWAQRVIKECDTYTEVSVSGTGVKLLGLSDKWKRNMIKLLLGSEPEHGTHVPQIDIRFDKSFFGLTGQAICGGLAEIGDFVIPFAKRVDQIKRSAKEQRSANRPKDSRSGRARKSQSQSQKLVFQFNKRISISQVICEFGWTDVGSGNFQRPGKADQGHSATTRVSDDGIERVTFWTTDADPFETSEPGEMATTYNAFDCWVLLRFDGDFGRAIRKWEQQLKRLVLTPGGRA